MSTMRRRHRIVCSSDEEEEDEVVEVVPRPRQQPQDEMEGDSTTANLNFQNVTLNSTAPPSVEVSDCAVGLVLQEMGLRLRSDWLQSCLGQLQGSVPRFPASDDVTKAKLCFHQFLYSDMNFSGAGVLPPNVHKLQNADLKGPFVLQVDEIVNISNPLRGRYQESPAGIKRCLKLSMTDGTQRVFGMEYRPIKGLHVMAPAGVKVAICNVNVRHGLLMLVPEVFEVLGGMVEELEGARQRLVNEVNKPPRGRRTRNGDVPPLATRLTLAAWPVESATATEGPGTSRGSEPPAQFQERGTFSGIPASNRARDVAAPIRREDTGTGPSPMEATHASGIPAVSRVRREDIDTDLSFMDVEESHMASIETMSRIPSSSNTLEDTAVPIRTEFATPISRPNGAKDAEDFDSIDAGIVSDTIAQGRTHSNIPIHITTVYSESDELPTSAIDVEVGQFEHPFVLSGDKEVPFTYMASLSAMLAVAKDKTSRVKGKIKCFLTGVKGFQYQQRSTYELRVYVDDGSLISEIVIDHNVVQKRIGYSPAEVTNALASSDRKQVNDMRETMKQFQRFLVNFEGTMVVEMTEECPIPVATEMKQGCPSSDAWLLLRRLQHSTSPQLHSDTIDLSP